MEIFMAQNEISVATIQRLPIYLDYLKSQDKNTTHISATTIALALGFGEVQVRKDLASVSSSGKPKIGYHIRELIKQIEEALGYNNVNNAIIIGAGKLGCALLGYEGFPHSGLNILAAFDIDSSKAGKTESGKPIYSMEALSDFCKKTKVHIGIITVPAMHAQSACDALIEAGILAVWNFAPAHLDIPEHIIIKNENMASSFAVLSSNLAKKLNEDA
jgi:redox-sensing transcriptional repressor